MTYLYILIGILFIPLMAWLDRQRGTPKDKEIIPKIVALLGMGYLCAFYTGHVLDWHTIGIVLGVSGGHALGLGEPTGHALTGKGGIPASDGTIYEKWQVGSYLRKNPWAALIVRGALVGLCALLGSDPVAALKIGIAFSIAFLVAPALVRFVMKMPTKTEAQSGEAWARHEWIRGGIVATLLLSIM